MKKKIFMVGVLAVALTFGLAQNVSAQMNAFSDAKNRDEQFLELLEAQPYYWVAVGDEAIEQVFGQFYQLNTAIEGLHYTVLSGAVCIFFRWETERAVGDKVVMLYFDDDPSDGIIKAKLEKDANIPRFLGPFGGDASEAGRRASLRRILTAANAYRTNHNTLPQQW
jgi:hypothetical protein